MNYNYANYNDEKKSINIKILVVFLFVTILIVGFVIIAINLGNSDTDKNINSFTSVTRTTNEQQRSIEKVLSDCGVKKINSIRNDEFLNYDNMVGFYINTDGYNNVILMLNDQNRSLVSIKYMGNYLYKDSKIQMTIAESAANPYKDFKKN